MSDSNAPTDLPASFLRRGDGLYFLPEPHNPEDDEADENRKEIFLCGGSFDVVALVRNEQGNYFRLAEFQDLHGKKVRLLLPMESEPKTILKILRQKGLRMARPKQDRELLVDYIENRKFGRHVSAITHRWHHGCYLTQRGAIGPSLGDEEIMFDESFVDQLIYCGTLDGPGGWKNTLGTACVGNRLLTFGVSVALASLVLTPLKAPCIGFLLYGGSSLGKSTTTDAARSVTGTPFRSCHSTQNSIEETAFESGDTLLTLDELGLSDAKKFGDNAYMIGSGTGKGRYGRKTLKWKVAWIVNGEKSLLDFMAENNLKMMPGQEIRLLSIPADVGKDLGSFDTIHVHASAKEFAEAIAGWAQRNQGVLAKAFLEKITEDLDQAVRRLTAIKKAFVAKERKRNSLTNAPPLVGRALEHFAIVAAAGELATEFGLTGWPEGEALRAVSGTFESWFLNQSQLLEHGQKLIEHVVRWIDKNEERLTVRLGEDGLKECDIAVDVFRDEVGAGLDYTVIARQLKADGMLKTNKGPGFTLQRRNGSQRYEVYCIRIDPRLSA